MPSRKFLLVKGVDDVHVSDPRAAFAQGQPARLLGRQVSTECKAGTDGKCETHDDPDHVLEHYEIVQQIVEDHPFIRKAIEQKELLLIGETIAKKHEEAAAKLAAKQEH